MRRDSLQSILGSTSDYLRDIMMKRIHRGSSSLVVCLPRSINVDILLLFKDDDTFFQDPALIFFLHLGLFSRISRVTSLM